MTDALERWATRLLPQRTDEADEQGKDADLKFLREGRDALRRSGYLDLKPGSAGVMPDPVRALGGAGANFVGQAAMGAGAPILGGALAGAGAAQLDGADAKGTAVGAGLGAALPAAMEAAPAAARAAKGLFARIAAPVETKGPQLALAQGGAPSFRPPRGASPAEPSRARTAIAPAPGSIPPEAMPPIPKAAKPLALENEIPVMDDWAEATMKGNVFKDAKQPIPQEIKDAAEDAQNRLYNMRRFADKSKKLTANDVIPDMSEPSTGVRTVRPPRGKRAAKVDPGPKLPSETGKRVPLDAEQLPVQFPEEKKGLHWLEGELGEPKVSPLAETGVNASQKHTYETPEGPKSAVWKPAKGALPMPDLKVPGFSLPAREEAASDLGRILYGEKSPVPRTVTKKIGDERGSLQEFVPDTTSAFRYEDPAPKYASSKTPVGLDAEPSSYGSFHGPERAAEVASKGADPSHQRTFVLDMLSANPDRHGGNLLLQNKGAGPAVAIDNGYAFGAGRTVVPNAVPYSNTEFLPQVEELLPEVQQDLGKVSLKKIAEALNKHDGSITPAQVRNTLARTRDLQYNPKQLKGLDKEGLTEWVQRPARARGLSGPDVAEIDRLTGADMYEPYYGDAPKLEGVAPLEGEQLSLTDLLNKLR